mmetsp:Transcript_10239/g.15460  ORF Transcript_10239/g.15460 Transcript_10239/m.15460 type:complete len:91 (+) Transcript_10239:609-881(+)
MTIVPPTERNISMRVEVTDANASAEARVETVQNDSRVRRNVTAKIEYHHPAISFRVDPSHNLFARKFVIMVNNDIMDGALVQIAGLNSMW